MKIHPEKDSEGRTFIVDCVLYSNLHHLSTIDFSEMEYIIKIWYLNDYFSHLREEDFEMIINSRGLHHTTRSIYNYLETNYPYYIYSITYFVSQRFSRTSERNIIYYFGWILSYRIDKMFYRWKWYCDLFTRHQKCIYHRMFYRKNLKLSLDHYFMKHNMTEMIVYEKKFRQTYRVSRRIVMANMQNWNKSTLQLEDVLL